jgi:superfamily II DNA or RNA helicase
MMDHKLINNLAHLRQPQREALANWRAGTPVAGAIEVVTIPMRGIVILPCGSGKTAVILQALVDSQSRRSLIVTQSVQGVLQLRKDILTNTNIDPSLVKVAHGDYIDDFRASDEMIVITTYSLFSKRGHSASSAFYLDQLRDTELEFVGLDEVHAAPAKESRKFVHLMLNPPFHEKPRAVLGVTATPFREESRTDLEDEGKTQEKALAFIGPIVHRASWSQMQLAGVIAQVSFLRVDCPLDAQALAAVAAAKDDHSRNDIRALFPLKLEVASAIVRFHQKHGHVGIIFVERLVNIKLLKESETFKDFEIVCGSNSIELNMEAIDKLERGEIPGLIATRSGDQSINLVNPNLCYAIKIDGAPNSRTRDLQRTGRVTRTGDKGAPVGELDAEAVVRRRAQQKKVCVYLLVAQGQGNPEEVGADYCTANLKCEGYHVEEEKEGKEAELLMRRLSAADLLTDVKTYDIVGERLDEDGAGRMIATTAGMKEEKSTEKREREVEAEVRAQHREEEKSVRSSFVPKNALDALIKKRRLDQYDRPSSKAARKAKEEEEVAMARAVAREKVERERAKAEARAAALAAAKEAAKAARLEKAAEARAAKAGSG